MSTPDVLAALEQRVAALEQAQGDELQPGVFSINSKGELVETIGQLHANGIVLPAGHVSGSSGIGPGFSSLNEIAWEDAETGGKIANVTAYNYNAKPPSTIAGQVLSAFVETGGRKAGIEAFNETSPSPRSLLLVYAGQILGKDVVRTILDQNLQSDWLQIASTARAEAAFATTSIKWAAKGVVSEQKAIVMPFGEVLAVQLQAVAGSAGFVMGIVSVVGATITVEMRSLIGEFPAGTESTFSYFVIGR